MTHKSKWIAFLTILTLLLLALLVAGNALAQEEPSEEEVEEAPRSGQVQPPRLIEDVQAEYTDEAIEARIEGDVTLELVIDASGEVREVEIVEGLGYGLDEAAMEAVRQFRFRPATLDGNPIPVALNFIIRFSLPILPAQFTGRLADPETDQGIAGARITIVYDGDEYDPVPQASTSTDDDGHFTFEDLPAGTYTVSLEVDEYRDFQTDIDLPAGETVEVEYSISRELENITGEIREAGTRRPLAAMDLTLVDVETGEEIRDDFSRSGGRFAFRGVPPGEYVLRVESTDYITATFDVEVAANEITTGTFYIRARDYDSLTVRTTARRERAEVNRQTVQLEEVRRIPGAGGDVVRVVQNLPGVARPQFLGGQIIVRGAAPEDTQIFLEGDSIPIAFHFLGGPAILNTEMISSVDFYPGNFSPYYGRATAGIIDMRTRSPRSDRFHGMLEVDLINSTALLEGPISDRWSFAISGRRSYFDLFLPSILGALGTDTIVAPRYYDYQSWLTYRSDEGDHKVEFFVYGSDDTIEVIFPDGEPQGDAFVQLTEAAFDNNFHRGQVRWEWTPEDSPVETTLMGSFGLNAVGLEAAENLFFHLDYYQSQIRQDTRIRLSEDLRLRVGLDAQLGQVRYRYAFPNFDVSPDATASDDGQNDAPNISADGMSDERSTWVVLPAVYTEAQYRLFDRLTLTPGLRADYYGDVGEVSISPRFSTRYQLTDELILKGGVGLFTQPPLPGQTEEDFGNPDITFEKAMHYAIGTEWRPAEHLEIDTTIFYRDNFDLVATTSAQTVDEDGNRRREIYNNEGLGRAYGWELLLRHYPRNNFFGWISYTLSRSERWSQSRQEWDLYGFDQTHILTFVAGYNLPRNFDLTGRFRLVTGNPDTPVVGAAFDADQDSYQRQRGAPNSVRSAAFHQLDLRLDRRWIFDTWILSAYLDVTNVYNAVNQEGMRYNYDFTDSEPLRGLPFLPTLGVSARF